MIKTCSESDIIAVNNRRIEDLMNIKQTDKQCTTSMSNDNTN